MKLTGFTDEAARDLSTQIKVTKELGWDYISARGINGKNIHELTEEEFDSAASLLEENKIKVAEFGSLIGNWAKPINSERIKRLSEITKRFTNAGLTVAHENCMNYGGFSADHTLELIEAVPDLKLIFDTGNPV